MKNNKSLILVGISLMLILAVTLFNGGCGGPASTTSTGPIKIGLVEPVTGDFATLGQGVVNGFNLALEEANYQVAGRSIQVVQDDEGGGDPTTAMNVVRKEVEGDNVNIMVGPFIGSSRMAVFPYLSSKKIPDFDATSDANLAYKYPYVYSVVPPMYSVPQPLGWFAYDQLGCRKIITIAEDIVPGHGFTDGFVNGFTKQRNGTIVQQQWTAPGAVDYSSYVVAAKDADACFAMMLPNEIGAFIVQANQMGLLKKMPLLLEGTSVLPVMLKDLGPILMGHAWSHPEWQAFYDSVVNKNFISAYQAKYNSFPDFSNASGFTRGMIVLAVLQATNGDTNPDKIHEAMKALKIDTPEGIFSFTAGNADKSGVEGITTNFIEQVTQVNNQYVWSIYATYNNVQPVLAPQ